jgi:hypothetical protein
MMTTQQHEQWHAMRTHLEQFITRVDMLSPVELMNLVTLTEMPPDALNTLVETPSENPHQRTYLEDACLLAFLKAWSQMKEVQ